MACVLSLAGIPLIEAPRQVIAAEMLLGAALTCLGVHSRFLDPTELLNELGAAVLLLAVVAYGVGFWPYYGSSQLQTAGVGTVLVLLFVCAGIATLRPHSGLFQVLRSRTPAGQAARVLLPLPFVLPFLFSWMNSYAMSHNLYDPYVGMWLFAVANTAVFALLISWAALLLHRAHSTAVEASEQLRIANDSLERRVQQRTEELLKETQERTAAMEELARSNADLEQFAYIASHDLQEPLRNVTTHVQLLRRRYGGSLDHGALEVMAVIEAGAKRMSDLVRDMLAYSRVMHEDVGMSAVDAGQLLAEVLIDIRAQIDQEHARVTRGPMPEVVADATQLRQLLQNLVGNALKYHPADSRPEISVTAEERSDEWVFAVRDNGIGISEEYHERIFGLFKRLHRHQYPGTGVGLAICRRVVQMHGGHIWVESKPGEGATFYFTLPKRAAKSIPVSS
jgi:signal transduction histidine kinase